MRSFLVFRDIRILRLVSALAVLAPLPACEAAHASGPDAPRDATAITSTHTGTRVPDDDPAAVGTLTDGSVQGRYVARIARLHDGTARKSHHLVFATGELELRLPPTFAPTTDEVADVPWQRNTLLRAYGSLDAQGVLEVDDVTVVAPPPQPLIDAEPYDPRSIALILLRWGDNPGLMNGYGKEAMFEGAESVAVFYGEASYGRERMIGEVFGPYDIPDPGGCDPYSISQDAQAAMSAKGHDPSKYSQLMYHFPQAGCDFAGLADIGSPQFAARDSWYQSSLDCVVRNQELGHNYGMGHSHAYDCGVDDMGNDVVFADNCGHIEYGDPYDPMGDGCAHINAVQKLYMGWLDGCNLVDATADGTFNLVPLERPCNGTQALRIPAFDGRSYYLEYRQPIGAFDADLGLDGVLVHVSNDFGGFGPSPYFLRVGENGVMKTGTSFTDPMGTVSFTVDAMDADHAVVTVTFADGGSGAPTCLGGATPETEGGAVGSLACADAPYPPDDAAPTVNITSPANGDMFDPGASFTITAEASDDRLLSDLVLYLDSQPVVRLYEPPWSWDVTNIPAGTYEFGVIASDGRNQGFSEAVTVQVGAPAGADTSGGATEGDATDDGNGAGDGSSSGAPSQTGLDDDGGCSCRAAAPGRGWSLVPWLLPWLVIQATRRRRPWTMRSRGR